MSILLPLYIYPWPGVWDPLYNVATRNPTVNFTAVINPCNGPCVNGVPEQPYIDELPKLKQFPNIRTLGYVSTNYTSRNIDDVIKDVRTWARYPSNRSVSGIFFDEVPATANTDGEKYYTTARNAVKRSSAFRDKLVVHNPGTLPSSTSNYLKLSDITVIFEETYAKFQDGATHSNLESFKTTAGTKESNLALMVHSAPDNTVYNLTNVVKDFESIGSWFFITSVSTQGEWWHSFSSLFGGLVEAVAYIAGGGTR